MAKVMPITERFQHFVEELQESFWGDLYGRTRQAWKNFFELESEPEVFAGVVVTPLSVAIVPGSKPSKQVRSFRGRPYRSFN